MWVRETLGDTSDPRLLAQQLAVTTIIDAAVDLCDMENWKNWASRALAAVPRLPENFPDRFFELRQRVAAAIWPLEYDELKRSTSTLAILLHHASAHFLEHAEENHGYYFPYRFYKAGGHNSNYDKDLADFEAWLDEFYRLIKEATKAANWFAEVVRRDVNPLFLIEAGKFVVIEGPFSDLKTYARIPEFDSEEKDSLPSAIFKGSLVSN